MVSIHKKLYLGVILAFLMGCATDTPWEKEGELVNQASKPDVLPPPYNYINPEEMYLWTPPSEEEVSLRRQRQRQMDSLSGKIEKLLEEFSNTQDSQIALEASLRDIGSKLEYIDAGIADNNRKNINKNKSMGNAIAVLNSSVKKANKDVAEIKRALASQTRYKDYYRSAVLLFRKGKFKESVIKFQRSLTGHQPRYLEDNIHFGIGSAYYKLKNFPAAINSFSKVVNSYRGEDKWLHSHVMLGMIYGLEGEKSKAITILEKALKSNPPKKIRLIAENLLASAKSDEFYAEK